MWKTYQLIYKKVLSTTIPNGSNIDTRYLDNEWSRTNIKFKARNRNEGIKKARKFWEKGHFGIGSIDVVIVK